MRTARRATMLIALALAAWTGGRRAVRAQQAPHAVDDVEAETQEPPPAVDAAAPSVDAAGVIVVPLIADAATPVARGRGVNVTAGEVYQRVQDAPEVVQRSWAAHPDQVDQLVDRLVSDRLLVNEARRLGLDRDPAVQAALERALVSRLRATVVDPAAGDATRVTDEEIRAFYDGHPARFHIPERRTARVIFFTHRRDAERVLRLARTAHRGRPLHDFRVLAAQYNIDPDLARDEGELRDLTPTQTELDPRLRDAVFAIANTGDVNMTLVRASWRGAPGYFVIRLISRRPAVDRSFAESADWIRQRLVLEHRAETERQLVDRLSREAGVVRLPPDRIVRLTLADAGHD